MSEEYYSGMFGSLKHNILLMLSQIEGNLEHSKFNILPYLEFMEKRIKEIKERCQTSTSQSISKGQDKEVKPVILDDNLVSLSCYAEEYPENWKAMNQDQDKLARNGTRVARNSVQSKDELKEFYIWFMKKYYTDDRLKTEIYDEIVGKVEELRKCKEQSRKVEDKVQDNYDPDDLTQCPKCHCMTKTIHSKCGKCGAWKIKNNVQSKAVPKMYSEEFIVKTLIEFFEDSDVDGRGINFSFYDSDKEDLLSKFMTTKGFRSVMKKAGLVGNKLEEESKAVQNNKGNCECGNIPHEKWCNSLAESKLPQTNCPLGETEPDFKSETRVEINKDGGSIIRRKNRNLAVSVPEKEQNEPDTQ